MPALHLEFDSATETCKIYQSGGVIVRTIPMHDWAVRTGFGRWGRCPRGTYRLGHPVDTDHPALGFHFTPLIGVPGRQGIGIHGGGSGLADSFAPEQGWVPTHGCLRVQNADNDALVALIRHEYQHGTGDCWITVVGP